MKPKTWTNNLLRIIYSNCIYFWNTHTHIHTRVGTNQCFVLKNQNRNALLKNDNDNFEKTYFEFDTTPILKQCALQHAHVSGGHTQEGMNSIRSFDSNYFNVCQLRAGQIPFFFGVPIRWNLKPHPYGVLSVCVWFRVNIIQYTFHISSA